MHPGTAALERGLRILDALGAPDAAANGLTVLEATERIGGEKSQVSRSLATLVASGYVERDPSGAHRLGARIHLLAAMTIEARLLHVGMPILRQLAHDLGESAHLSVRQGDAVLVPAIEWGPGLGDDIARARPASFLSPSYSTPAQAIYHQDGSVERLLRRLRGVLVPVSAAGIVATPVAVPLLIGHPSRAAVLAALVLWTGLYFSVAQFNLRLAMSARGKAGWDAVAMVAGLAVLFAASAWPVECTDRPMLVAGAWCAAECTSLAVKYAVLWRRGIGAGTLVADLATLAGLGGLAALCAALTHQP